MVRRVEAEQRFMSRTSDIGLLAGVFFVLKDFLVEARYVFSAKDNYIRVKDL